MDKDTQITVATIASIAMVISVGYIIYRKKTLRQRIVRNTKKEYNHWGKGELKETSPLVKDRLFKYWEVAGVKHWSDNSKLNEPWSAAFISYVLDKSGVKNFKPNTMHSAYIQNAKNNKTGIVAHPPYDVKIKKGDIVCYARQSGISYGSTGSYLSHCDIVVDIKQNRASLIGGNLSDSVNYQARGLTLDANGKINKNEATLPYIAVLKPD